MLDGVVAVEEVEGSSTGGEERTPRNLWSAAKLRSAGSLGPNSRWRRAKNDASRQTVAREAGGDELRPSAESRPARQTEANDGSRLAGLASQGPQVCHWPRSPHMQLYTISLEANDAEWLIVAQRTRIWACGRRLASHDSAMWPHTSPRPLVWHRR